MLSYNFVPKDCEDNLKNYKYLGTDKSLLYKHVFSPIAQACVDHVFPRWLAPNIITLVGLLSNTIPHLLIWKASPYVFSGPFPSWLCYLGAIGQFGYIILDNSDGKQARKTSSASPLGLLFDHGCDAVNTFIAGTTLIMVTQFGNTPDAMIAYLVVLIPFYMATWEEFYTDHLMLPIINGPNEGIVGVMTLFVISGILGTHIWTDKVWGVRLNQIALVGFISMALGNSVLNVLSVAKRAKGKFMSAIFNLTGITYLVGSSLLVSYLSPSDIISRKPRELIYFFGFLFSKMVGQLQVGHVTKSKFNQFSKSIWIPITLLNLNTLIGHFTGKCPVNEDKLVNYLCIASVLIYAHYAVNIVRQFCRILKVKVFTISKPDQSKIE